MSFASWAPFKKWLDLYVIRMGTGSKDRKMEEWTQAMEGVRQYESLALLSQCKSSHPHVWTSGHSSAPMKLLVQAGAGPELARGMYLPWNRELMAIWVGGELEMSNCHVAACSQHHHDTWETEAGGPMNHLQTSPQEVYRQVHLCWALPALGVWVTVVGGTSAWPDSWCPPGWVWLGLPCSGLGIRH